MCKERYAKIRTKDDLIAFVNKEGFCYLFKKEASPRLWELTEGEDTTIRRGQLLAWLEEAHLNKKLFLSVDEKGRLVAISWQRFEEMREANSKTILSVDEKAIIAALERPLTTPELRKASGLPESRFEKALIGLRSKMRVTLVDVKKESRTKHVNCYDRIERWMQLKATGT
jgi:hypothetical protein